MTDSEYTQLIFEVLDSNNFSEIDKIPKGNHKIDQNALADRLCLYYEDIDIKKLNKLIELGFDVNIHKNDDFSKPYWQTILIKQGLSKAEKILSLKGLDINSKAEAAPTILFLHYTLADYFTKEGELLELVKLLIQKSIDIKATNQNGRSALFFYCDHPEVMDLLLSQGLDINAKDDSGLTPFGEFCLNYEDNQSIVERATFFIERGVDIHSEIVTANSFVEGMTPLFLAIKNRSLPLVEYLLAQGADKKYISKKGVSALELALKTKKKGFIALFEDEEKSDYSSKEKILQAENALANQDWNKVLEWGHQVEEKEITWELMHMLSYAYRKDDQIDNALEYGLKGIERFGVNNLFMDNLIFIYLVKGEYQKAIEFWRENNKSFDPKGDAAANTIGHMVVAYDQLSLYEEGVKDLKEYADLCHGTGEGRSGFSQFNFACLYGRLGDLAKTIYYSAVAIESGYTSEEFECDDAFDNVRETAAFELLMAYGKENIIYHYLTKGDEFVFFYSRSNDECEIIHFNGKGYENRLIEAESLKDLILQLDKGVDGFLNNGFSHDNFDYSKIWIPAWDDLFKRVANSTKQPLGELRVEWDFCFNEEGNSLQRPYYAYGDNGFDLDSYDDLQYIPSESIFREVMKEVVKLDSFQSLCKSESIKLIQSEHDSGDEFIYEWSKEN